MHATSRTSCAFKILMGANACRQMCVRVGRCVSIVGISQLPDTRHNSEQFDERLSVHVSTHCRKDVYMHRPNPYGHAARVPCSITNSPQQHGYCHLPNPNVGQATCHRKKMTSPPAKKSANVHPVHENGEEQGENIHLALITENCTRAPPTHSDLSKTLESFTRRQQARGRLLS
jgi:hypothetical protein